jgi:CheY-like chemotaxis protein
LFLANMSHELRTPLNGVLGLTELLMESEPRGDQIETLGVMRRSGEHLMAIINDVIDFTRLDANRLRLGSDVVDLQRVVTDILELMQPAVQRRGLTLSANFEPSVPPAVRADELRLRQVLTNLVGNAVKFTGAGSVTVTIRFEEGRLGFAVQDTGPGIAPEVQVRLFQPFEQAEAEANRRYGGSGLGLAISRRLVELMGGELELASVPGKGSTFTFQFPATPALLEERPARVQLTPRLDGAPRSVLVVDDNEVNLHVATALLRKVGCAATAVKSGREAIEAVDRIGFDAVLMDCHMPEVDGFEATRCIRKLDSPAARIPIVALTASVLPEELTRCLEAGMNACVTKPVTLAALREALARVLEDSQARG